MFKVRDLSIQVHYHYLTEYRREMKRVIGILVIIGLIAACSKEEEPASRANPFNDPSLLPPEDTTTPVLLDSGSFEYLYANVFKVTCANSGCHDGNFEPDFRTIYSSYNSLVNHLGISNDVQNSYTYRVEPNNSAKSLMYARLTIDIPNTSGKMPAAIDPGSDWSEKGPTYIELIKNWIDDGAPDAFGNRPTSINANPQVVGFMAFNSGSTTNPLVRFGGGLSPLSIPNTPIDVWFSFADDQTDVTNFKLTQLKSSYELFDFDEGTIYPLNSATPISGSDFWNNTVNFTHKATISFPTDTVGSYIFLRTYLQDDMQIDTTENPNFGTNDILRSYFTLKVDSL